MKGFTMDEDQEDGHGFFVGMRNALIMSAIIVAAISALVLLIK